MFVHRSMAADETVYRDPDLFLPERFLPGDDGLAEPRPNFAFGFGRRYV